MQDIEDMIQKGASDKKRITFADWYFTMTNRRLEVADQAKVQTAVYKPEEE